MAATKRKVGKTVLKKSTPKKSTPEKAKVTNQKKVMAKSPKKNMIKQKTKAKVTKVVKVAKKIVAKGINFPALTQNIELAYNALGKAYHSTLDTLAREEKKVLQQITAIKKKYQELSVRFEKLIKTATTKTHKQAVQKHQKTMQQAEQLSQKLHIEHQKTQKKHHETRAAYEQHLAERKAIGDFRRSYKPAAQHQPVTSSKGRVMAATAQASAATTAAVSAAAKKNHSITATVKKSLGTSLTDNGNKLQKSEKAKPILPTTPHHQAQPAKEPLKNHLLTVTEKTESASKEGVLTGSNQKYETSDV